MKPTLSGIDWSLVQTFLAVAEHGTLSEAARALGASQPTVGRHIRQIEESLDLSLFRRRARGLSLTASGAALLPYARQMQEAARGLGLVAAGRSERLSGPVRITASVFEAHHFLPPVIARLRREEPDITIDLVPNDASENLLYREADIAVRMYQTKQLDIVTRHIGEVGIGIFAAKDYLDRCGRPETLEQMFGMDLVGYDRSDLILRGMRDFGLEATRDWFATRCDHHAVYWQLIRAGCGIGFAQLRVGQKDPDVERLFPDVPLPPLGIWLAAHEAMRQTPRIRRVWDILVEELEAAVRG